jgi:hypothetical protein
VYRHEIQQLVDLAPVLVAKHQPLKALRLWFERLARYGRIKHGLADVLHAETNDEVYRGTYGPMVGAIDLLLEAGRTAGSIRKGIDAEDVLLLMGFLWRIEPGRDGEARAKRLLTLVMNGLES